MSTGSIQNAPATLHKFYQLHLLPLDFTNGSGVTLKAGHEVYLSADNTVSLIDTANRKKFPIGYISVGGDDLARVRVNTVLQSDLVAIAKTSARTFGEFVKPNGVLDANGVPEYILALPGEAALGVVLKGATGGGQMRVGLLRSPYFVPGTRVQVNAIKATSTSQTTDFGGLLVGDYVAMIPATPGDADFIEIATDGDLGQAAVVGNLYVVYRAS